MTHHPLELVRSYLKTEPPFQRPGHRAPIRLGRLVTRKSPEEGPSETHGALEVFDRPVPPVSEEVRAEVNQLTGPARF